MATTNYTTLLGLALPTTGDLSGTWGTEANTAITSLLDTAVAGTTTLSADTDVTLSTTNGAANQARSAVILWTATGSTTRNITAPAQSKAYVVINATGGSQSIVIRGAGPTTGVTIPAGNRALVAWNGSDFVTVSSTFFASPLAVTGNSTAGAEIRLPEDTDNGSNYVALKAADTLAGNVTFTLPNADGTNGQVIQTNGSGVLSFVSGSSLATPLAVIGNSSAGAEIRLPEDTDNGSNYVALKAADTLAGNVTFTLPNADGTNGQVLQTNGSGTLSFTTPSAGITTAGNNTFTGIQTFAGTSSNLAVVLTDAAETTTISATAATGTINYDVTTQAVLYYTSNASANWTVNFRGSSGTSLNTLMSTGQSITVAFLVTQGATAYYNNVVQVDGSAVTPKWQGGTAPTAGNASSIDVYSYTIVKTGSAAFTIFASQTKFA